MKRPSKIWLGVAVIFTLVNLAGAPMALYAGEVMHALVHVVLTFAGFVLVSALWARRRRADGPVSRPAVTGPTGEMSDRLTNLEQAIEAVAIEVERVGEGQRFMTKVMREDPSKR